MASLVVTHVTLGPEALAAALWALEGTFVDMDPHMNAKILFFTEGFSTGRECTLKGLGAVV